MRKGSAALSSAFALPRGVLDFRIAADFLCLGYSPRQLALQPDKRSLLHWRVKPVRPGVEFTDIGIRRTEAGIVGRYSSIRTTHPFNRELRIIEQILHEEG